MSAIIQAHQQRSLYEQLLHQLKSPDDSDDGTGTNFIIPKNIDNPNTDGTGTPVTIEEVRTNYSPL